MAHHHLVLSARIAIFSCLFLLFQQCSIYDPPVRVPSFIQIDSIDFSTDIPTSGYNTQNISEVWIYANDQVIGVYSIPTGRIPVLAEGDVKISVSAGVFADGVFANKVSYPFYSQYQTKINLTAGALTKIYPRFLYDTTFLPFPYYQDFETAGGGGFSKANFGTVDLTRPDIEDVTIENKFGKRYGKLTTVTASDLINYSNDIFLNIPQGNPIYLEFDYKSSCSIVVGLVGENSPTNLSLDLVLRPTTTWTKIYASLSDEAQKISRGEKVRFFFRTVIAPGAGNTLMLDNIRLIHSDL